MVTGIKIRVPGSQNFKIKKCKSAVSLQEKFKHLIFCGMKLKTAGKMYFHTRLMIPKKFLGLFHFLGCFCGFLFFPQESYSSVKLEENGDPLNNPENQDVPKTTLESFFA